MSPIFHSLRLIPVLLELTLIPICRVPETSVPVTAIQFPSGIHNLRGNLALPAWRVWGYTSCVSSRGHTIFRECSGNGPVGSKPTQNQQD